MSRYIEHSLIHKSVIMIPTNKDFGLTRNTWVMRKSLWDGVMEILIPKVYT